MSEEKKECQKEATVGLIMPISMTDNRGPEHWLDVKEIITEAIREISDPNFSVKLVSAGNDVEIIHKRIIQNIYSSDVVVCDVSGKNPNVMFELGMRLAFDKPAIIIKDDMTDYTFDTGIIEHLTYPHDLRFGRIMAFKKLLKDKVLATYKKTIDQPEYSPFIKNFGEFQVAELTQKSVSSDQYIVGMLRDIQAELSRMQKGVNPIPRKQRTISKELDFIEVRLRINELIDIFISDYMREGRLSDNKSKLLSFISNNFNVGKYFDNFEQFNEEIDLAIKSKEMEKVNE